MQWIRRGDEQGGRGTSAITRSRLFFLGKIIQNYRNTVLAAMLAQRKASPLLLKWWIRTRKLSLIHSQRTTKTKPLEISYPTSTKNNSLPFRHISKDEWRWATWMRLVFFLLSAEDGYFRLSQPWTHKWPIRPRWWINRWRRWSRPTRIEFSNGKSKTLQSVKDISGWRRRNSRQRWVIDWRASWNIPFP